MYAIYGVYSVATTLHAEGSKIFNEITSAKTQTIENIQNTTNDTDVAGDRKGAEQRIEDIKMAEFTAYTSEEAQTNSEPYITADGTDLRGVYECVIASNSYEFGTKLAIEDLGVCEVHDRMNPRYDEGNIDVYFGNDKKRALEFGRKTLSYIVID